MKINNVKEVHDLVKARRTELKFPQHQITTKLNIKKVQTYCNKENLKFMFTLDELILLSDILDFNIIIAGKDISSEDTFTKIIKSLREENKMSQNAASQIAGLKSHPSYFQKEKGKTSFKVDEILNLCNYFNIDFEIILNVQGAAIVE